MALSPYVFDADAGNFNRLVLENSHKGPVLVHYWTPKAGPCFVLMPRLVQLATEYGGRFLLVMANADEQPELARRFAVNSVPTVKFFRNGEIVHTIHGAESDATFREALDRFIAGDADRAHQRGLAAWQAGHVSEARMLLANAAMADPEKLGIARDLAKLLLSQGEAAQALALIEALPPEARAAAEIAPLYAHLALLEAARLAPEDEMLSTRLAATPDDPALRLARAGRAVVADDYAKAFADLLALYRHHRDYRAGLPRACLLALFELLGGDHPQVRDARRKMSEAEV